MSLVLPTLFLRCDVGGWAPAKVRGVPCNMAWALVGMRQLDAHVGLFPMAALVTMQGKAATYGLSMGVEVGTQHV